MSQGLRIYEVWTEGSKELYVGAFVGGEKGGNAVQLTIGSEYASLTDSQVLDLISVLARRLKCEDKWNATGIGNDEAFVQPDGSKAPNDME